MKVKVCFSKFYFSAGPLLKHFLIFGAVLSSQSKVYCLQAGGGGKMASNNAGKPNMRKEASQTMRQLDQKKGGKGEIESFPTTLEGFKYRFNEQGQLRHLETEGPFQFAVKDDRAYNQKHYEALGEVITEKVYELLETDGKLKKHFIPVNSKKTEPCSFIFMSEDALTNEDKLLVLIHGSGVVRAGQWTRKLIINEDLDKGTQLPYIKRAMQEGYGVIVLNTNLNTETVNGKEKSIKGSEDPEKHGVYVWRNFIQKSKAKHVAIVGHSMGGVVTVAMAREFLKDFQKRVFAIGFTDSVHSAMMTDAKVGELFEERAVNWVTSDQPLDSPMRTRKNDAKRVSAGHEVHEWTSWAAFESVFKFFTQKYNEVTQPTDSAKPANDPEPEMAQEAAEMEVSEESEQKKTEETSDEKQGQECDESRASEEQGKSESMEIEDEKPQEEPETKDEGANKEKETDSKSEL